MLEKGEDSELFMGGQAMMQGLSAAAPVERETGESKKGSLVIMLDANSDDLRVKVRLFCVVLVLFSASLSSRARQRSS
jgi:hypothetical protein